MLPHPTATLTTAPLTIPTVTAAPEKHRDSAADQRTADDVGGCGTEHDDLQIENGDNAAAIVKAEVASAELVEATRSPGHTSDAPVYHTCHLQLRQSSVVDNARSGAFVKL